MPKSGVEWWALALFVLFACANVFTGLVSAELFRDAWVKRVIYLEAPFSFAVFGRVWAGHVWHALLAALVLLGAWGWGVAVSRVTGRGVPALACLGLGFGVSGGALLAAGLCGLFHPAWAGAWCVAGASHAILVSRVRLASGWQECRRLLAPESHEARRLLWLVAAMGAVCLVVSLAPEGGWDPVYYHLRLPKLYEIHHKIHFVPWIFPSHYPQGIEMLYGLGWLLGGEPVAKLVNWSFWLWSGLALARLAADAGPLTRARALALALTMPLVGTLACENYIDLGLTFLELLALDAALRGRPLEAGLLAGAAMGSKYTAIACAFGLGAAMLLARVRIAVLLRAAAAAALPVLPWLGKNVLLTGDPFAPLLWGTFGKLTWAGGIDQSVMGAVIPHHLTASAPARAVRALLLGPWEFVRRTAFAVFNPVPLALLPALAWRWQGRHGFIQTYVLAFTILLLVLAPDGRYWQPAVFPLCLLAAAAWDRMEAGGPRAAAGLLRLLGWGSVAFGLTYHALDMHRMFTSVWAAVGLEEPRRHMVRTRVPAPWYLPAVEHVNMITPPGRRVAVISDVQAYLVDRDAIFDCDQPGTRRWVRNLAHRLPDERALARQFRQWNATRVFYIRGKALGASRGEAWSPAAEAAWVRFWRRRARLREDVGECAIYELGPPGRAAAVFDVPGVQETLVPGLLVSGLTRPERARRLRAAAARAESGYLHGVYGEALLAEGALPEAVAALRRAAAIEPRSADVWFTLARALAQAGRIAEARAAFARGRRLRPWAPDVPVLERELAAAARKAHLID